MTQACVVSRLWIPTKIKIPPARVAPKRMNFRLHHVSLLSARYMANSSALTPFPTMKPAPKSTKWEARRPLKFTMTSRIGNGERVYYMYRALTRS